MTTLQILNLITAISLTIWGLVEIAGIVIFTSKDHIWRFYTPGWVLALPCLAIINWLWFFTHLGE